MNPNNESIFVGNLSYDVTTQELRSYFEEYGINTCGVDLKSGFAFVYVDKQQYDTDALISRMKGGTLGGKVVTVEKSIGGISAKLKEQKRRETLEPTNLLFVVGFGNHANEQEVRAMFSPFGNLRYVEMRTRFCFVAYYSIKEATEALDALNDKEISDGRVLSIEYSQKKSHTGEGGGHDDAHRASRQAPADRNGNRRSRDRERDDDRDRDRNRDGRTSSATYLQTSSADASGSHHYRSPGVRSAGGAGTGSMPMNVASSTAAAIRDREIAEAFIRMREWEAYYFSLIAERDAVEARGDMSPPSYAAARRPSSSPNDDHVHARGDSRPALHGAASGGRDQPRDSYHNHNGSNSAPTGKRFDSSSNVSRGSGLISSFGSSGGRRSRSRSRSRDRVFRSGDRKRDSRDSRDRTSRHPAASHDSSVRSRRDHDTHGGSSASNGLLPATMPATVRDDKDLERTRRNSNDEEHDDIADMYVSSTHMRSRSRSLSN